MNHLHGNFTVTWQDGEVLTHPHRAGSISDGRSRTQSTPADGRSVEPANEPSPGWLREHIKQIIHSVSAHFEKSKDFTIEKLRSE